MFLQASVILSTGGGGESDCLSACWDTTPPRADTIPRADTPVEQTPPKSRHPPHPRIQSTSSRYASYWNAFLFYYQPQRSCGQGNVFTGVCLSTGGGCLSQCMLGSPPWTRQTPPDQADPPRTRQTTPPGTRQTPPRPGGHPSQDQQTTPPSMGSRLQHMVYERPVRILLECILVM